MPFAFSVEGTVTRDEGSPYCWFAPPFTFVEDGHNLDPWLGFAASTGRHTNVLIAGITLYRYYYDYGPTTYPMAFEFLYDGSPYGSASFDGRNLLWSMTKSSIYTRYDPYYNVCPGFRNSYASRAR